MLGALIGGREPARGAAQERAPPAREAGAATIAQLLKRLKTDDQECRQKDENGNCKLSPDVIGHIVSAATGTVGRGPGEKKANAVAADPAAVKKAAAALGCDGSVACAARHPRVHAHVEAAAGPQALARFRHAAEAVLKPPGPRHTTALLSNFDIDGVLEHWAAECTDFHNCPFAMMDFLTADSYCQLRHVRGHDLLAGRLEQTVFDETAAGLRRTVRRPNRTLGCVLNTDVSTGPGKHWVCVFVDCRGDGAWTIEYFNSSGNPPPSPVVQWAARVAGELDAARDDPKKPPARLEAVSDVRHQKSNTECGVYSLYYIRSRLDGRPSSDFANWVVPDDAMVEFRRHLFSSAGPGGR